MMTVKTLCACMFVLVCTQSVQPSQNILFKSRFLQSLKSSVNVKNGLYLLAAAAIGGCLYKGCHWLSTKHRLNTDRAAFERTQEICHQTHERYDAILQLTRSRVQAERIDENILSQIAQMICPHDNEGSFSDIAHNYKNQLTTTINELDQQDEYVASRLARSQIAVDLARSRTELSVLVARLIRLKEFIHRFNPLIIMSALVRRHQTEIAGLQQVGENPQERFRVIRAAVMRYHLCHKEAHPYLRYVQDLSSSLEQIPADYALSDAHRAAYNLLRTIADLILGSEEYHDDHKTRRRAIEHQQDLEVQKMQAKAAIAQANAAQADALARKQRAEAELEKAYEARRQRQRK